MVEIQQSNPDILCLQELEMAQFEEYFSPELADQGYHGGFYPKSRSRTMNEKERRTVDGCAIFYKSQRLYRSLLLSHEMPLFLYRRLF